MASQTFHATRSINDSGQPLPLILANPAWQSLMDRIDSNISQRSYVLEQALDKLPAGKRPSLDQLESNLDPASKRSRTQNDLELRKDALLAKIDNIEGVSAHQDDYEAYRRQCWIQYYEWMDKQKKGGVADGRADVSAEVKVSRPSVQSEESSADEDEEIHNALLGLS
jgi:hypothetical protein